MFPNIIEAAKFHFDELERRTLLEHSKTPILRDFRDAGKRLAGREKRLVREQKKYEDAEGLQKTAQMLTSSGMKMDQHYESVTVTDYFREEPAPVDVPLDSTITLRENIDKMFKRYQKAGKGRTVRSVVLRGLPGRAFTLKVIAITSRHHRLVSKQRYVPCTKARRLHTRKRHHRHRHPTA